jgi:hypothetical protein
VAAVGGFQFAEAVTEAVDSVASEISAADPGAFRYRGADLEPATKRILYIQLVNNSALLAAYLNAREGDRPDPPPLANGLEQAAALQVLSGTPESQPPSQGPSRPLPRVRRGIGRIADRVTGGGGGKPAFDANGPVLFVLDHPKYQRFIAPIVAGLGSIDAVVAAPAGEPPPDIVIDALDAAAPVPARRAPRHLRGLPNMLVELDDMLETIESLGPRCVVVAEGGGPVDAIAGAAAQILGVPSVCLQHGWSPLIHTGFRDMPYASAALWGEGFRDLLAPFNPGLGFHVTGTPLLEGGAEAPQRLQADLGGRRGVGFFLQPTSPWNEPEHLEELYELAIETARSSAGAISLVREHPGDPLGEETLERFSAEPNLLLVSAADYSLREVLDACAVAVSIYSSTLLEAAALGIPVVVFNPTSMPRMSPDLEALGAGLEVDSLDAAIDAVERSLNDPGFRRSLEPGLKKVRERYFASVDGLAVKRIAALLAKPSLL